MPQEDKLTLLHRALVEDEKFSQITPARFEDFISEYGKPDKLTLLHRAMVEDEKFSQIMPADFNEAAKEYGLGKFGAPKPDGKGFGGGSLAPGGPSSQSPLQSKPAPEQLVPSPKGLLTGEEGEGGVGVMPKEGDSPITRAAAARESRIYRESQNVIGFLTKYFGKDIAEKLLGNDELSPAEARSIIYVADGQGTAVHRQAARVILDNMNNPFESLSQFFLEGRGMGFKTSPEAMESLQNQYMQTQIIKSGKEKYEQTYQRVVGVYEGERIKAFEQKYNRTPTETELRQIRLESEQKAQGAVERRENVMGLNYLSKDEQKIAEAIVKIKEMYQDPNSNPFEIKRLLDEVSELSDGASNTLYDYRTGAFVSGNQITQEVIDFNNEADQIATQNKSTPLELLLKMRRNAYGAMESARERLEKYDRGVSITETTPMRPTMDLPQIGTQLEDAKSGRVALEKLYREATAQFLGINRAIMLNEDPARSERPGLFSALGISLSEGLGVKPDPTKSEVLSGVLQVFENNGIPLTDAQKENAKASFKEQLGSGIGTSLVIMGKIMLLTYGANKLKAAIELPKYVAAFRTVLGSKLPRSADLIMKILTAGGEVAQTAMIFEGASADFGTGAGEGVAGQVWGRLEKFMKLGKWSPLGRYLSFLGRIAAGTAGETIAEYTGELSNLFIEKVFEDSGMSWKEVFEETFGSTGDEATDKFLLTATICMMFSTASNVGGLLANGFKGEYNEAKKRFPDNPAVREVGELLQAQLGSGAIEPEAKKEERKGEKKGEKKAPVRPEALSNIDATAEALTDEDVSEVVSRGDLSLGEDGGALELSNLYHDAISRDEGSRSDADNEVISLVEEVINRKQETDTDEKGETEQESPEGGMLEGVRDGRQQEEGGQESAQLRAEEEVADAAKALEEKKADLEKLKKEKEEELETQKDYLQEQYSVGSNQTVEQEINARYDSKISKLEQELAALEGKPTPQSEVEATAKALEGVETFHLVENEGEWKATTKSYRGRDIGNWVYSRLDKKQTTEYNKLRDAADNYGTKEQAEENLKKLKDFEAKNKDAFEQAKQAIDKLKQEEESQAEESKKQQQIYDQTSQELDKLSDKDFDKLVELIDEKRRQTLEQRFGDRVEKRALFRTPISESYHKAKADGSNPELVKAVEELLGKKAEPKQSEVEATAKALEGVEETSIKAGRTPVGNGKFVRYNPDDVLPLLKDFEPTNIEAVEDYVNQTVPNDASVEVYKLVPIDAITPSEKIEKKDRDAIEKIKEGIKRGDDIPPIVLDFSPVIKNGEQYGFGIMDGHHRYIAYKELGIKEIPSAIVTSREHYTFETNDENIKTLFDKNKSISEAYHKAKAEGSNPELVKAVEELLGKKVDPEAKKSEPKAVVAEETAKAAKASPVAKPTTEAGGQGSVDLGRESQEVDAVAERSGVRPKNFRDLYRVNREVFGLNKVQSLASAIAMDRMIGVMAKRAGVTKAEMYGRLRFEKASEEFVKDLSAKGKVLFQLVGENAQLAQDVRDNLQVARDMETAGKDAKTIRMATGWEKGKDGKWRYEIFTKPPFNVKLNLKFNQPKVELTNDKEAIHHSQKLGDIIRFPELFEAYPKLKNIPVDIYIGGSEGVQGSFSSAGEFMLGIELFAENEKLALSGLLHEIQHAIQDIEGFAKGNYGVSMQQEVAAEKEIRLLNDKIGISTQIIRDGNDAFLSENIEELSDLEKSSYQEILEYSKSASMPILDAAKVKDKIWRKDKETQQLILSQNETYRRTAGEVEARNVQKRMGMTPEQRRATTLQETEDVARDEQIVLFGDGGVSQMAQDLSKTPNAVFQGTFEGQPASFITFPEGISIVDGWYSPIEKRLRETRVERQSANKWLTSGLIGKGDEATYTGVKGWLEGKNPQEQVSKQEILDWMKDNRVEIVEVVKGFEDFTDESKWEKRAFGDGVWEITANDGTKLKIDASEGEGEVYVYLDDTEIGSDMYSGESPFNVGIQIIQSSTDYQESSTKFSQYQLEGEKSNYKEVLVTLPVREVDISKGVYEKDGKFYVEGLIMPFDTEAEAKGYAKNYEGKSKPKADFKSSHFDEPNILVHLRMNTRTDADGNKVLFLEEIQSDWGQKGKKEGFDGEPQTKYDAEIKRLYDKYLANSKWGYSEQDLKRMALYNNDADLKEIGLSDSEIRNLAEIDKNRIRGGVPTAPFVTDTNAWTKLGLKMAMREAVSQGADKIAWTTGEQQFDRWGTEKIDWVKSGKGWTINIQEQFRGTAFEGMNVDEKALSEKGVTITSKEELKAAIDRNLSREKTETERQKLTDRIWDRMQKEDSGTSLPRKEGMEAFYDRQVRDVAKAVVKELTGQKVEVGETKIPEGEGIMGKPTVEELAKAKELALKDNDKSSANFLQQQIDRINKGQEHSYALFNPNEPASEYFDKVRQPSVYTQQSIDITPELKAQVQKGMPLFQRSQTGAKGAMQAMADGTFVIYAITDPNVSTPLHELAHVFEHYLTNAEKTIVQSWAKTKGWTTETSEAFARGFEKYLAEGKAPTTELQKIFDKFKQWLTDIYNGITNSEIDIELNDEMRAIYDKMLGKESVSPTKPVTKPSKPIEVQPTLFGMGVSSKDVDASRTRNEKAKNGEEVERVSGDGTTFYERVNSKGEREYKVKPMSGSRAAKISKSEYEQGVREILANRLAAEKAGIVKGGEVDLFSEKSTAFGNDVVSVSRKLERDSEGGVVADLDADLMEDAKGVFDEYDRGTGDVDVSSEEINAVPDSVFETSEKDIAERKKEAKKDFNDAMKRLKDIRDAMRAARDSSGIMADNEAKAARIFEFHQALLNAAKTFLAMKGLDLEANLMDAKAKALSYAADFNALIRRTMGSEMKGIENGGSYISSAYSMAIDSFIDPSYDESAEPSSPEELQAKISGGINRVPSGSDAVKADRNWESASDGERRAWESFVSTFFERGYGLYKRAAGAKGFLSRQASKGVMSRVVASAKKMGINDFLDAVGRLRDYGTRVELGHRAFERSVYGGLSSAQTSTLDRYIVARSIISLESEVEERKKEVDSFDEAFNDAVDKTDARAKIEALGKNFEESLEAFTTNKRITNGELSVWESVGMEMEAEGRNGLGVPLNLQQSIRRNNRKRDLNNDINPDGRGIQHGRYLTASGGVAPWTLDAAKEFVSRQEADAASGASGSIANISERARAFFDYQNSLLKEQLDAGIITKSRYDDLVNRDYITRQYVGEGQGDLMFLQDMGVGRPSSKGDGVSSNPLFHTLKGGSESILNTNTRALAKVNALATYRRIAHAEAVSSFVNDFLPTFNQFKEAAISDRIKSRAKDMTVDQAIELSMLRDGGGVLRPIGVDRSGKPTYRDMGKKFEGFRSFEIMDSQGRPMKVFIAPGIYNDMTAYSKTPANYIRVAAQALNTIFLTGVLKFMATGGNIRFAAFQLFADPYHRATALNLSKSSTYDFVRGFYGQSSRAVQNLLELSYNNTLALMGMGDKKLQTRMERELQDAVRHGLNMTTLVSQFSDTIFGNKMSDLGRMGSALGGFVDKMKRAYEFSTYFSGMTEVSGRLDAYSRLTKKGVAKFKKANGREPNAKELQRIKQRAASAANDVMNYSRTGDVKPILETIMPFYSAAAAAIRGQVSGYKTQGPWYFLKVAEMVGLGTMIAYMRIAMDEEDRNRGIQAGLDTKSKVRGIHVPLYVDERNGERSRAYLQIPTMANFVTGGAWLLAEKIAQEVYYGDYRRPVDADASITMQDVAWVYKTMLTPIGASVTTPSAAMMSALFANFDTYRNEKIYKGGETSPELQITEYNQKVYYHLARAMKGVPGFENVGAAQWEVGINKVLVGNNPITSGITEGLGNLLDLTSDKKAPSVIGSTRPSFFSGLLPIKHSNSKPDKDNTERVKFNNVDQTLSFKGRAVENLGAPVREYTDMLLVEVKKISPENVLDLIRGQRTRIFLEKSSPINVLTKTAFERAVEGVITKEDANRLLYAFVRLDDEAQSKFGYDLARAGKLSLQSFTNISSSDGVVPALRGAARRKKVDFKIEALKNGVKEYESEFGNWMLGGSDSRNEAERAHEALMEDKKIGEYIGSSGNEESLINSLKALFFNIESKSNKK